MQEQNLEHHVPQGPLYLLPLLQEPGLASLALSPPAEPTGGTLWKGALGLAHWQSPTAAAFVPELEKLSEFPALMETQRRFEVS